MRGEAADSIESAPPPPDAEDKDPTSLVAPRPPRRITPELVIASMGGIGYARPFPGTWGSMLVLPAVLLGSTACLLLSLLVLLVGWWAIRGALRQTGAKDPGWIVVDEGAGQLLALAALPSDPSAIGLLLAFVLFRALDIWKIGPVGWADRMQGPSGVMLDDVVAGALAAGGLLAFDQFYPGMLT